MSAQDTGRAPGSAGLAPTAIRDVLFEAPGPRTRRLMRVCTAVGVILVATLVALVFRQFYLKGQFSPRYWFFFTRSTTWAFLANGFVGTLKVAAASGILSLVLGLVLMLGRTCGVRVVEVLSRVVIDFFRGVPSLLLIYFFFLVVPQYGVKLQSFWMITLPVGLAASGVLAEVFRAGVNAVPQGQVDAALSLGMSRGKIMAKILLPQAIRFVIPTLVSQLVVVVKDTTLAYVVSYPDLMQDARVLINNYTALVSVYLVVAVIYVVLNYLINKLAALIAARSGVTLVTRADETSL